MTDQSKLIESSNKNPLTNGVFIFKPYALGDKVLFVEESGLAVTKVILDTSNALS